MVRKTNLEDIMTRRNKIITTSGVAILVIVIAAIVGFNLSSSHTTAATTTTTSTTTSPNSSTSSTSSTSTTSAIQAPAGTALPSGFEPQSATFVSTKVGFVLGTATCSSGSCLTIARTEDGGKTWLKIPSPNAPLAQGPQLTTNSAAVSKIRFVNILDGYLFGPNLYTTHDGGATWHQVSLSGIPNSYGVMSLETNQNYTYLIAGNPNAAVPGAEDLFVSPANNDSFKLQSSPTFAAGDVAKITTNPYGTIISANDRKGDLYYQAIGSSTWTHLNASCTTGIPTNPFVALTAPQSGSSNPEIVIACGGDVGAGSQQKTIMKSTNLSTFSQVSSNPPLGGVLTGIASPNGQTIAVTAASGSTFLYVSTNAGQSWTTVIQNPAFGGAPIHDLGFTTNTQGFAVEGDATKAGVTSSEFLMTHDGGTSWQSITF